MASATLAIADTWSKIAEDVSNVILIQVAPNENYPDAQVLLHASDSAPGSGDTGVMLIPSQSMEASQVADYVGRSGHLYAKTATAPQTVFVRLTSERQ